MLMHSADCAPNVAVWVSAHLLGDAIHSRVPWLPLPASSGLLLSHGKTDQREERRQQASSGL